MKGSTTLFRIFGIDIKLHFSWWFVFFLLAWALSAAFFPQEYPGFSTAIYWFMGITAAILLFVSVLLHELSHSLVARAKKIKVESITLFFFGGVAGITKEDMKPSSELQMALAGPIFSLLLAVFFYLIYLINGNVIFSGIFSYLYKINFILAIFNMIPGFPLDGGRALRAVLYWYTKDLKKSTRIAVSGGKVFAGYLILEGILNFFGIVILLPGGLWFILLGVFLYFIAGMSYQQVVLKELLSKVKVKDLMQKKYISLSPGMTFADFLKKYNYKESMFIIKDKKYQGILDLRSVNKVQPKLQKMVKLKQLSYNFSEVGSLGQEDNVYTALRKFTKQNLELLPVMGKGKLLGIITRKSLENKLMIEMKFGNNSVKKKKKIIRKKK